MDDAASIMSDRAHRSRGISIHRWLQPVQPDDKTNGVPDTVKGKVDGAAGSANGDLDAPPRKQTPQEKSKAAQWTFTKVVHESLNPSVNAQDADDFF